jgi:hypothetical protein
LTALACTGERLQWRRFAISVPFELNALLPEHRPMQALTRSFVTLLQAELGRLAQRLRRD